MDVSIVKPKQTGSLHLDIKKHEIKNTIYERIAKLNFPDITKYKHDLEFLNLILNLIENLVVNKKINKKELVFEVLQNYFQFTEEEKKDISDNIEYLLDSKQVKKISYYKLFCVGLKELMGFRKFRKTE